MLCRFPYFYYIYTFTASVTNLYERTMSNLFHFFKPKPKSTSFSGSPSSSVSVEKGSTSNLFSPQTEKSPRQRNTSIEELESAKQKIQFSSLLPSKKRKAPESEEGKDENEEGKDENEEGKDENEEEMVSFCRKKRKIF